MTEVAFHFNVEDKSTYVCRLLRKAFANGARVIVTGHENIICELDTLLWTFSPVDFLPHSVSYDDPSVIQMMPILLSNTLCVAPLTGDTLLNLWSTVPDGFEQYSRVIEVVTLDSDDRSKARGRWKLYTELGVALVQHQVRGVVA